MAQIRRILRKRSKNKRYEIDLVIPFDERIETGPPSAPADRPSLLSHHGNLRMQPVPLDLRTIKGSGEYAIFGRVHYTLPTDADGGILTLEFASKLMLALTPASDTLKIVYYQVYPVTMDTLDNEEEKT